MQKFFRLTEAPNVGVSCSNGGLFVGDVALLERAGKSEADAGWQPRRIADINRELSRLYGFEVDALSKLGGLAAVSRALERNDLVHAQLAALFLRFPEPPSLSGSTSTVETSFELAKCLRASGLLKSAWDPARHPRWPAGTAGGAGGEFAPAGQGGSSAADQADSRLNPHQIAVPFPGAIPGAVPRPLPLPGEIVVPPLVAPQAMPRNPYPADADCAKEWAEATEYCRRLADRGLLGKGDYRQHGKTFRECVMGQVSERCGGNIVQA